MLDVWLQRTRQWISRAEKLLPLPEQEFAAWALARLHRTHSVSSHHWLVTTICGDPGSGKSSLIRQSLQTSSTAAKSRKVVVAEAREWSRWIADRSDRGKPLLDAGTADCLVCENVHQLVDLSGEADRLAAWLDQARALRVPVIVTSDCLPSHIQLVSPRLVNRLQGGLLVTIRTLSRDSQQRLWQHWSNRTEAAPPPWKRTSDPLITTAGQLRQLLTAPTSRSAASRKMSNAATADITLDLIAERVAQEFHVSAADLCAGTRTHNLKIPRCAAMSLARELTNSPLTTISRHFGCRSHTTVVRSCARLQESLAASPALQRQMQQLRAKLGRQLSADCG